MAGKMKRCQWLVPFLGLVVAAVSFPAFAEGQGGAPYDEWFHRNYRVLTFVNVMDPADSSQNPDNAFLQIPHSSADLHVRADFVVDTPIVDLTFKPRVTATAVWWSDGAPDGRRDRDARFFVNEWLLQPKPTDELFLSFGKQKLLWGPSFLVSPSNILFKDIEKVNPRSEVEGKYLATVTWLPNRTFTLTGIARTGHDEDPLSGNQGPLRALKLDVMGGSAMASVIGYAQHDGRYRFGSFGQWTATDALVLYYDGIVSKGTDALYPMADPASPTGGDLVPRYEHSSRFFGTVAAGGSYTFLSGETLYLEYLYNGTGYGDADAEAYYRLRGNARDLFFSSSPAAAAAPAVLARTYDNGTGFLRRQYVMAQLGSRQIADVLSIIARYTYGVDEGSGQAATMVEWQVSDRVQFFNINTVNLGGPESEFGSAVKKSMLAGIEVHY